MSLFHKITSENHLFQRRTLYAFAKFIELPLLKTSHKLLRGDWRRLGEKSWLRKVMTEAIARPFALYGDTAHPIPYGELLKHIDALEGAIAVGSCRCRIVHGDCDHPVGTDIVIRTGTAAWLKAFPKGYHVIAKEEAKAIVTNCHRLGMFHMVFLHCPATGCAEYVICNCCPCGCVPYILNRELGQDKFPFIRGEWTAETKRERCRGCSECVRVCPFAARAVIDGKGVTWDCFGCGLCAYACPEQAIELVRDTRSHHDHPGIQNLTK